jgi:hypothetical protein
VRVHNVPAERATVERLLNAGVDLVGATDVRRFARVLEVRSPNHAPPERQRR